MAYLRGGAGGSAGGRKKTRLGGAGDRDPRPSSYRPSAGAPGYANYRPPPRRQSPAAAQPTFKAPSFKMPSFNVPSYSTPTINVPSVKMPKMSLPTFTPARVKPGRVSNSYQATFKQAIARLDKERASLDGQYKKQRSELRGLYKFAETEDERRRIATQVAELDRRRDYAISAIDEGYAEAQAAVSARGDQSEAQIDPEAQAMRGLYTDAADSIREDPGGPVAPAGLGVSADGGPDKSGWVGFAETVGAAEEARTRRMGESSVEDIRWLADTMSGESEAQQAGVQQLAMGLTADARQQHDAQVAARIQAERMQYAQQVQQMQSQFMDAGIRLSQQGASTLVDMANRQAAVSEANAQMAMQASTTNAQMGMQAQMATADAMQKNQAMMFDAASQQASMGMQAQIAQASAAQDAASQRASMSMQAQMAQASAAQDAARWSAQTALDQQRWNADDAFRNKSLAMQYAPQKTAPLSAQERDMQKMGRRMAVEDARRKYGPGVAEGLPTLQSLLMARQNSGRYVFGKPSTSSKPRSGAQLFGYQGSTGWVT